MKVECAGVPGVLLLTPLEQRDDRGAFFESWQLVRYAAAGLPTQWVQDNVSHSRGGVLRGLHLQHPAGQGKLVTVLAGEILDVAVDVRRGSPHFGRAALVALSRSNARQLYVPAGFAHGFLVTSESATVHYKCTQLYRPAAERVVAWNDPAIGIAWPVAAPVLSPRDAAGRRLDEFAPDELPVYVDP